MNKRIILNRRQFAVCTAASAGALLLPRGLYPAKANNKLKLLSYNVWYGLVEVT